MLLCQNCHTKRTAMMRLWPVRLLDADRTQLDRVAAFLRALADHHAVLSGSCLSASRYVQRLADIVPAKQLKKLGDPFHQEEKS